jgi:hypothetical protein
MAPIIFLLIRPRKWLTSAIYLNGVTPRQALLGTASTILGILRANGISLEAEASVSALVALTTLPSGSATT